MSRQPVLIALSVLAGMQVLFAGAALGEVLPDPWPAFGALVVAASTAGMGFYLRGEVLPVSRAQELVDAAARTGLPMTVAATRVGEDPYEPPRRG